jgi:rubredoxin
MEINNPQLIKINMPGGILSAGDFYEILLIAQKAGAHHIRLGNRQQLYFNAEAAMIETLESDMLCANIDYEKNSDTHPNMMSSYIAEGIFSQESWLKEGVYKDILDLFNHRPLLKINLADSNQTFIPFFTGNINFISSDISNYWYLYIRYPKTSILYCWPTLIYSDDIPAVSKLIEEIILRYKDSFYDQTDIDSAGLYQMVTDHSDFVQQQPDAPLSIPEFYLPCYEGLNRYGNKYWLGIYRREELFAIDLLKEICELCLNNRIGQLYFSPWKSILIKNIETSDISRWEVLLNKYRVNVRHAANELNWQTEDLCNPCLILKKRLVKEFEEKDLRTHQLSFAIKERPGAGLFGSILIREQAADKYEIMRTRDFNPNSKDFLLYQQEVPEAELFGCLMLLCNEFYDRRDNVHQQPLHDFASGDQEPDANLKIVFRCKECFTQYDQEFGDQFSGILPGIPFESLDYYRCPTCDAGKENFVAVQKLQITRI